jgi:hypothetical protein
MSVKQKRFLTVEDMTPEQIVQALENDCLCITHCFRCPLEGHTKPRYACKHEVMQRAAKMLRSPLEEERVPPDRFDQP